MRRTKLQFPTTSMVKVSLKIKIKLSFIMHGTVYFLLKLNLWLSFTLVNRIKKNKNFNIAVMIQEVGLRRENRKGKNIGTHIMWQVPELSSPGALGPANTMSWLCRRLKG